MSDGRTSWWRLLAFYLNPRRWLRLRRRQKRLYWYSQMKANAGLAHTIKKDPLLYVANYQSFVTLSVEYSQHGGFDLSRVTERLMEETKPC